MKKTLILLSVLLLASACRGAPVNQIDYTTPPAPDSPIAPPVAHTTEVKVAVIALGDNGRSGVKIGCEDSVVYLKKTVSGTPEPMHAAFGQLFALDSERINDPAYPDLYNVLYKLQHKSSGQPLKFYDVVLSDSTAKVYLTGDMTGLGGVCDSPRVQAQIEQTALQFSSVKTVEVYLNNKLVDWQKFGSQK